MVNIRNGQKMSFINDCYRSLRRCTIKSLVDTKLHIVQSIKSKLMEKTILQQTGKFNFWYLIIISFFMIRNQARK